MIRQKLLLFSICILFFGCEQGAPVNQFHATAIEDAKFGKDFNLVDHYGNKRSLADYHGKTALIFFGFTHCPDVCPTTLIRAAESMQLLGDKSQEVQVLFITVDPERDTQELLKSYVTAFNPSFIGLRTSVVETRKLAEEFKVYYEKIPGKSAQSYSVDHSAYSYAYDKKGKLRLIISQNQTPEELAEDLRILIED